MPRAHFTNKADRQTAAPEVNRSGCLSLYSLSILASMLIISLVAAFAYYVSGKSFPLARPDSTSISSIFTKEIQYWAEDIVRWGNASSLDPNLIATVMQIESCGDIYARSGAGAMGLFQVMPFHFDSNENPFDTETNALRGVNYLSRSLQVANGDARLALAGYNGGIGVISKLEWMWPGETKRYVHYGAQIYEDARNGNTFSLRLLDWYTKYGAGLCQQASKRLGL
jgi:soluble lytic murein transglycosylase-like protein